MSGGPALSVDGLAHRYGDVEALRGVSLAVPAGSFTALVGPNGGGKTTLFRIAATLLAPTAGAVRVAGHDVRRAPDGARRALGVVFQSPALDALLTAEETLRVQGALYGLRGPALRERAGALLAAFDLTDLAGRRTGTLSGGQRRRVDLARGLVHRPAVLLLDEPTAALDPAARHAFWASVHALRRAEGVTVVAATHLLDEAEPADRVAILDRGRLVADGPPGALRAALGRDTLWLDADDAPALAGAIGEGAEAVSATVVRVGGADVAARLPELYARFGAGIRSATVRRPSLEDVFLAAAGRRFADAPVAPPAP